MLFYFIWNTSSSNEAKHLRVYVMVLYPTAKFFNARFPTAQFSHYNVCCFTMKFIPANLKIRVYEICYIHSLHRNEQLQNTARVTNSHILWNAISTTPVSPWRNLPQRNSDLRLSGVSQIPPYDAVSPTPGLACDSSYLGASHSPGPSANKISPGNPLSGEVNQVLKVLSLS